MEAAVGFGFRALRISPANRGRGEMKAIGLLVLVGVVLFGVFL
jgi:hypothetical protein